MSDEGPTSTPPGQPPKSPEGEDAGSASTRFATLKTLAFVLVIQVFALAITHVNAPISEAVGPVTLPGSPSSSTNPSGSSIYNIAILVTLVFAVTLAAVWLARRRRVKVFMGMVAVGTGIALFLLTLLASSSLTSGMNANTSLYISLGSASATIVVLALVVSRRAPSWFALVLTGLLSAEVGSYFASVIPILTALLLPLAFSLYDIYTVFRGPLKTLIMTVPDEAMATMSSTIGDVSLGTGDTVFYAMVPALGYYQFGSSSAFLAILAVDVGVIITLYLLKRVRLLPGLPIPMFLGIAVLMAFYIR